MATRRERNNLASKKSYEKAVERAHATEYEYAVVERHRNQARIEAWHWSVVPEDHLFEAGYIHDFAKHRLLRLMNKKRVEEGENRLRDYGLDGLARETLSSGEVVYHGLQAKYYTSRSVTAEDIGSFFAKQISMTIANPLSRGYLYTTTPLQADLRDEVAQPAYPLRHVLYPWKHADRRVEPVVDPFQEPEEKECDLPLRDYQVEVLSELVDGRNAICIPCRMGKTLIAGHWTKGLEPRVVLAIAPLKVSVENLRDRLACFLPDHAPLLVDSDAGGTTDEKEVDAFLEERVEKGKSVVVYSTFQSAMEVLSQRVWEEDTVLLVDEAHNAKEDLCEWIQGFHRCLIMSATLPDEVCEAMGVEHKGVVPFSKGIEGGYIVDYTLWLPSLTKHEDGSTSVEAEIPVGFEAYERSMVLKALYHAVCMLRTGSRRTIVYLGSQAECDQYMEVCRRVFEEYHGVMEIWVGKMTCSVSSKERKAILEEFQGGEEGSFRILTSVRILDEAVDIPSCDSVFITTVGEHSSDIRFFQRAQRSGTLDPKNPNKRNHIFLWAEGWERCVGALSLLREADPEFHAKVRHASAGYDVKESSQERAERVAKERVEFTEWSRMACETVEERMRRKCEMLMEWVEREGRVPPYKEVYQGVHIGWMWDSTKQGHYKKLYQTLLSSNSILRDDYERTEQEREKKNGTEQKIPEEKSKMLIEWVEQEGRVPPHNLEWKGVKLGSFWTSVKGGEKQELYRTLLSRNSILRANYEWVEQKREEKKEKGLKTPEEKVRILIEWVEQEQRVPPIKQIYRDIPIGQLWGSVKQGCSKQLYKTLLSTYLVLREDYERTEQEREKKKEKGLKTPEEKARMLLEWVEQKGRVPPSGLEWNGVKLGNFWHSVKGGTANQELYRTLLSNNLNLQGDYERTEQKREEMKGVEQKTPEEKGKILLEWVEQKSQIPPKSLEWKGVKLGQLWRGVIAGDYTKLYQSLLSRNSILRADYERVEQKREERKEKGLKTAKEKGTLLMEWVEQEGRVPPQSLVYKGVPIGQLWGSVKQGHNHELYQTHLSIQSLLKADYERKEQKREERKGKEKKTSEERGGILMEWVEQEQRVPPQSLTHKGVPIGRLWANLKKGQSKQLYHTLLSTNPILRADYERTEQEREEKKEKGLKTPEEKIRTLIEWVEQEQRVPPQSLRYKGIHLGGLWNGVKHGDYKKFYQTLLFTNPLLRADYDRLQLLKQQKKNSD